MIWIHEKKPTSLNTLENFMDGAIPIVNNINAFVEYTEHSITEFVQKKRERAASKAGKCSKVGTLWLDTTTSS